MASELEIYPEFISLSQLAASSRPRLGIFVITSGLRRVWEIVLEREGLSDSVYIISGGRIADGCVVAADVKRELVLLLEKSMAGSVRLGFWGWPIGHGHAS